MVIKIQVSIGGNKNTLIYNKRRSWAEFKPREWGVMMLGDSLKGYFKARFTKSGILEIGERIKDQDW